MATTVILAVCLEPLLPGAQGPDWTSAGYIFLTANSIQEAINHFKNGDFDLVLLGHSVPVDARERLTFLIRATGSRVPVVSIASSSGHRDSFADATFEPDSNKLLHSIGELLKSKAIMRKAPATERITALRESRKA